MHKDLLNFIEKENLFRRNDKILLAVSGGVDSVVMCDLFREAGISFAIAHCNFNLRGKESDTDEQFVFRLAKKYKVAFFVKRFDTAAFAEKEKISIQMAARDLRYQWLEEIRKKNNFNNIVVAHHQNDSIETLLINWVKGTGIAGLHGILPKNNFIVRPLLFATRKDIEQYASKNKLKYREDSSNLSDKYIRNLLRHKVIPVLKKINPSLERTVSANIERVRDIEKIVDNFMAGKKEELLVEKKNGIWISIAGLKKTEPLSTVLYELLHPYGFSESDVKKIISVLDSSSGKQFLSSKYRLLKDREYLIITPLNLEAEIESFQIKKGQKEFNSPYLNLSFKSIANTKGFEVPVSKNIACLDAALLQFPLNLRKWRKGDYFYPLGMKTKKKLSDFFIDNKLTLNEKENCWIITSGDNIVWVIGYRIDNRFKISAKTQNVYLVELQGD